MSPGPRIEAHHEHAPGVMGPGGVDPAPGRVVILNGASSSGKSTLDVVVDHVLGERRRLRDLVRVLDGLDVVFLGVRCRLDELERREREPGNRQRGRAAAQAPLVHAHATYDVEVDTSAQTVDECVAAVLGLLEPLVPGVDAFDRLREVPA